MLVPEALAYASIAGVSPVVGLYAAPGALLLYAALLRRRGRVRWTGLRMTLDGHPEPRAPQGAVLSNWEI